MSHNLIAGIIYRICNDEQDLCFKVKVESCPNSSDGVRLHLHPDGKYIRILQDGKADTIGGGGVWCYFTSDMHESGLLTFSRGEFTLACENKCIAAVTLAAVQASSAVLWSVAQADKPTPKAVLLCQGPMEFGPFIREDLPDNVVRFRTSDSRYLRIYNHHYIDAAGGGALPCQFKIQLVKGELFSLCSQAGTGSCLGVSPWGALTGHEVSIESQLFSIREVPLPDGKLSGPPCLQGSVDFDESVDITSEEWKQFAEEGYLIVRGAVPKEITNAALAEINKALLEGRWTENEIATSHPVLSLIRCSKLWTLAQRLLGRGCVMCPKMSQIALRVPTPGGPGLPDEGVSGLRWHIDGMDTDGYKPDVKYSFFSVLVGVALSDQLQPNCGNLVVFPGSHHVLQPMVQQEVKTPGSYPFLSPGAGKHEGKPMLTNGRQVKLAVGDAVLVHQKVAHRVADNCSPNIRYQTYFRLRHIKQPEYIADGTIIDDMWAQFARKAGGGDDDGCGTRPKEH
jgi:hypothetical protein